MEPVKTMLDGNWKVLERDAAERGAAGGFITFVGLLVLCHSDRHNSASVTRLAGPTRNTWGWVFGWFPSQPWLACWCVLTVSMWLVLLG